MKVSFKLDKDHDHIGHIDEFAASGPLHTPPSSVDNNADHFESRQNYFK